MPLAASPAASDDEIFAKIEKLAALHGRGILTDKEYQDKRPIFCRVSDRRRNPFCA